MRSSLTILAFFAYLLAALPTGFVTANAAPEPLGGAISASVGPADDLHSISDAIAKCCMKEKLASGSTMRKIDCAATVPEFSSAQAMPNSDYGVPPHSPTPQSNANSLFRPPIAA